MMNTFSNFNARHRTRMKRQRGLTLIELMVGLLLALLVTLAAVAALTTSRLGFSSVDAASQLRDNGRFASELVERVVAQAGYQDHSTPGVSMNGSKLNAAAAQPFVEGYDNTAVTVPTSGPSYQDGKGINGSDVIVVRYQGSSMGSLDATTADGSIIDCAGAAQPKTTGALPQSVLYVANSSGGEPSLMCGHLNTTTGNWSAAPLIQGVESFQVRYGVDSPNAAPDAPTTDRPQAYLPASALRSVDPAQQTANWQRVKAIRIGMVMRGPAGSAFDRGAKAAAAVFYPLGTTVHSGDDPGTEFQPGADGRLRQVVTFTVYLRNPQSW